jgi:hypothetical protein
MIDWSKLETKEYKLQTHKDAALTQVRKIRGDFFYTLAGLQSEALATGNSSDALAIATLQQSLRDITATDLSACTNNEEIDLAFLNAWKSAVAGMPPAVALAFKALSK